MSSSKSDIGKNCKLNPMSELHRLVALNRVGGWLVVGGWGQFFTVPNLQKPQNLPLELPPPEVCTDGPISLHDLSGLFGQVVRVLLCHR